MDAFQAAFRLPNILRRMFAEGAFSQAFVPILAEYQRQRGDDATRDLVGRVGALLALVLLGVTALGVLAAPALVYVLASGFAQTPGQDRADRRPHPHRLSRTSCSCRWCRSPAAC